MTVVRDPADLRRWVSETRVDGKTVGLVPTMGALHEGHLSLIRAATDETDLVIVSIFVNPKQFGPDEDFEAYPRDEGRDVSLAEEAGATLVYMPKPEVMYPTSFSTAVEVQGLTEVLCGAPSSRGAAHFRGVTTVVCKLLNTAAPDRAYFGQKDAQQVAVIKRMVSDLDIPVEIRVMPTVREPDGLAMSSRNAYLNADQRRQATSINLALRAVHEELEGGTALETALGVGRSVLREAGIEPEYLEARDLDSLAPAEEPLQNSVLIAVAAPIGTARLIDNFIFEPTAKSTPGLSLAMQGGLTP